MNDIRYKIVLPAAIILIVGILFCFEIIFSGFEPMIEFRLDTYRYIFIILGLVGILATVLLFERVRILQAMFLLALHIFIIINFCEMGVNYSLDRITYKFAGFPIYRVSLNENVENYCVRRNIWSLRLYDPNTDFSVEFFDGVWPIRSSKARVARLWHSCEADPIRT